jgi:glycosyltransferase involved in cell wall biosynthesis
VRILKRVYKIILKRRSISVKNILSTIWDILMRLLFHLWMPRSVNADFQKNIDELISLIPDSNGSNYYKKADINIGIITDEFMYNYYKDAVNLFYMTPKNYREIIDGNRIDIVLFVSCWKGMGDETAWLGMENRKKAIEVFSYAKEKGIPTVFQSIEDPSNYSVFIEIAKAADYIFTSCIEVVEDYKKDTCNQNVFVLDYGINPLLHNPVGMFNKRLISERFCNKDSIFFAGSWAPRYKERCEDMRMIFDGVIHSSNSNLVIADRNMNIRGYTYPYKYAKYIIPPIDHTKLQKVHKLFTWTININSIKNSRTMCAMRVYEVQALGGLMISNYALSVSNNFPNIFMIFDGMEVKHILKGYPPDLITDMQLDSIRNVMSGHTVFDKLNYVFNAIGFDYCFRSKKVLVVCEKLSDSIRDSFERQTYGYKELRDYSELLDLNKDNYDYLIIFRDGFEYSRYFLEDLVNAFKYTDVSYTTYTNNQDILPYNYVENTNGYYDTMYDITQIDISDIKRLCELNMRGFLIKLPEYRFSAQLAPKKLGVIIPVFNNGKYLKDRCIKSLVRSSIFSSMQLYIIDDGSTDNETIIIIKELEQLYGNITTYFYHDGGSGSASRPRNKGVELCREEYVTYLDPDNEAVNDGYAILMEIIEKYHVDLAFGTVIKVSNSVKPLRFMYKEGLISSPRQELLNRKFKTQSIQACVIKKSIITENRMMNPIGAVGQDTLFFYELMLNARGAYHTLLPIHIYYAQRSQSVINTIDKGFFEKCLLLERYQVHILKKYNVFDEYVEKKFEYFYNNWYLDKLKLVSEEDYETALKIVNNIALLYNSKKWEI